jgi:hypothetical protein
MSVVLVLLALRSTAKTGAAAAVRMLGRPRWFVPAKTMLVARMRIVSVNIFLVIMNRPLFLQILL